MPPLRVALVSTASTTAPGSMRAYADLLLQAMQSSSTGIEARLIELDPSPAQAGWRQRANIVLLPWRARRLTTHAPHLWHILDGSRAYVAEGLHGAPVVITAHDMIPVLQQHGRFPDAPNVGRAASWLWHRNGAAMKKAQGLICVSENTRRDLSIQYGEIPAAKVVPLPVRPELAALASRAAISRRDDGVILHVGNNSFYKNRQQVLRIFAALDKTLARRLVMAGAPPSEELRALSVELGIEGVVEWVVDADDVVVADWYARASALVFPSLYEGFGWPVLEAMTFGLPVVCSNAGSLPEVVGASAPCFAPDDIAGFVGRIEALLRDSRLHASCSEAVRLRAEEFGMQRFARETSAAYRVAVEAGASR